MADRGVGAVIRGGRKLFSGESRSGQGCLTPRDVSTSPDSRRDPLDMTSIGRGEAPPVEHRSLRPKGRRMEARSGEVSLEAAETISCVFSGERSRRAALARHDRWREGAARPTEYRSLRPEPRRRSGGVEKPPRGLACPIGVARIRGDVSTPLRSARHDRERSGMAGSQEYTSCRPKSRPSSARSGDISLKKSTRIGFAIHRGEVSTRYARST